MLSRIVLLVILALPALSPFAALTDDAGRAEATLSKIRRQKGGRTIKCSPDGDGKEWLLPQDALAKLKKGDTLLLAPGFYDGKICINVDGVIIEGDADQKPSATKLDILIASKDCIIRNSYLRKLETNGSCSIVDSVIHEVRISELDGKRAREFFGNCLFGLLRIESRHSRLDTQATIYKCTVYANGKSAQSRRSVLMLNGKIDLSIIKSVVFGSTCFSISDKYAGDVNISMDESLLCGSDSMAIKVLGSSVKEIAMNASEMRKLNGKNPAMRGKCIFTKPVFVKGIPFSSTRYEPAICKSPKSDTFSMLSLQPHSPGSKEGMGASFDVMNPKIASSEIIMGGKAIHKERTPGKRGNSDDDDEELSNLIRGK